MNKLLYGDCLELLKEIPNGSVDMVCADLPYAALNRSNPYAQWDNVIDMVKLWDEMHRVCKPNAAIVLFGQGIFSAKLIMSNPKEYRYTLIWDKVNRPTGFLNANRSPLRIHEDILVFYRKQPTYNPQMTYGPVNHKRGKAGNARLENGKNRCYGSFAQTPTIITNEKFPTTILRFEKEHKNFYHPTCKPVRLLEWLIKTYSNERETVLDMTMGSGSTGVACANTKRNFIGIELTEEYFEIAKKRIHDAEIDNMQRLDL